jgi:hypothetical protein
MTKSEKIWAVLLLLAVGVIIMIQVRAAHNATLALQGQFGGPQSVNPTPPGQVYGPGDGTATIAADVGPWYLYYNTPGIYHFGPPVVNTSTPPNFASLAPTATNQGCATCQ